MEMCMEKDEDSKKKYDITIGCVFSFFFSLQKSENSYKEKIIGNNIIQVSFDTTQ